MVRPFFLGKHLNQGNEFIAFHVDGLNSFLKIVGRVKEDLSAHKSTCTNVFLELSDAESFEDSLDESVGRDDVVVDGVQCFLDQGLALVEWLIVKLADHEKLSDMVMLRLIATLILSLQGNESFLEAICDFFVLKGALDTAECLGRPLIEVVQLGLVDET